MKNQKNVSIDMSFLSYNISIFHISYKQFNMRRRIISVIIALLLLLGSSQASSALAWMPQQSEAQPPDWQVENPAEGDESPIERPEYSPPSEESLRLTEEQVQAFDCGTVTDVPRVECEALLALYQSTNGSAWTDNSNWLQSTTVGNWFGIFVETSRVTRIWLTYNNLNGKLPEGIGNFDNLEFLNLSGNKLPGSIPVSISQLTALTRLELKNCALSGEIPGFIGQLKDLVYLGFDDNKLSGNIPIEMGELPNLKSLSLFNNALSGSIPDSLGNLKNITYMDLSNNNLSGKLPSSLGGLTYLNYLRLEDNQLSGPIPPELGQLIQLESLDLRYNHFNGQIPSEFGNLVNLKKLLLDHNFLMGDLPKSITKLVKLCGGSDNPAGCKSWEYTDFGHNCFNVPQPEPQNSFMTTKDPDWADTQRVCETWVLNLPIVLRP